MGSTPRPLMTAPAPHQRGHLQSLLPWVAVIVSALAPLPSGAVDVPNRNSPLEDRAMREGREAVKKQQWDRAIALLQPYLRAHPQDADGHNLLAFSLRKLGRHAESETAYDRALALDPNHLGAHEYRGELMLLLGRREQALVHLQALERLCGLQCEEYQELRRAIDAKPQARPKPRW
jgi:tetratricopeptide (TPR) repeat protein